MSAGAVPSFDEFVKKQPSPKVPTFDEFSASAPISLTPHGGPGSNPEPVSRFVSNFASAINPVPGIREMASEASNPKIGLRRTLGTHLIDPQMDQFRKAKEAFTGTGEEGTGYSLPSRLSLGLGHSLAGVLPLVGPAAANAGEQIGSGDVAGGLGSGAGLLTTAAAPDMIRGVGKGLMRTAEPIAENSSGIAYVDRGFGKTSEGPGRTPGRAILDETTGVRPSTISRQARGRLGDINNELEGVVSRSNAPTHLQPARDVVSGEINKAGQRNSKVAPVNLQPMLDYLSGEPTQNFSGARAYAPGANTPLTISTPPSPVLGPNGQPLPGAPKITYGSTPNPVVAETQVPKDLLGMKRQFNEDYVRNWNPTSDTKGQLGVARQAAHELGSELHRAVPESKPLDVRASSLIPAAERSDIKALRAGPLQNAVNRFGAHTGALAGAVYGASTHGLPGAIAGIAIPEMLADPTTQMITARGLDYTGKGLRSPYSQIATRPAQAGTLIKSRQPQ